MRAAVSKSLLKSSPTGFGAFHRERATPALPHTGVAWQYFYGFGFS
jgi:hypothetical protein